ncbi:pentatricopeptide repeat-containing protein At4g38150-like [Salvia hispanica]|uniref:pentatricopeptide repeat-containing protein At4g38150-like n=1 Tax=Salvia hispanica TaxID=49212 RepID=UPI002009C30D|nr:pentatricopeptide repeat-containing protein At4g38150-like [Salvia hispanica]
MSIALRTKLGSTGARLLRSLAAARSFSHQPREPIPDRPLRNQSRIQSRPRKAETDADFLEKFKLGLDSDSSVKENPSKSEAVDRGSDSEDANEIFKKMKETGLIPNAVAMLDGLCKDGLVHDAMKLFGLMREKGAIPEVVVYTAVVEGFCKAQKLDDAVRIFKKMESNGIVPNAFSYQVLIKGLCLGDGRRVEEAYEFSIAMLEAGHSPNLATFTGLIDGYCREKGLEEAQSVVKGMRLKGFFVEEKAVKEYLGKKGPFLPMVWEAILGKKASNKFPF